MTKKSFWGELSLSKIGLKVLEMCKIKSNGDVYNVYNELFFVVLIRS